MGSEAGNVSWKKENRKETFSAEKSVYYLTLPFCLSSCIMLRTILVFSSKKVGKCIACFRMLQKTVNTMQLAVIIYVISVWV